MRDEPEGAALLDIAEATLKAEILPVLPAHLHYTARMIANAMRIAARQMRDDGRAGAAERAALAALVRDGDASLEALERRFAEAIRAGAFDADAIAHALLTNAAAARLAEVNPRALDRARTDGTLPPGFEPWRDAPADDNREG